MIKNILSITPWIALAILALILWTREPAITPEDVDYIVQGAYKTGYWDSRLDMLKSGKLTTDEVRADFWKNVAGMGHEGKVRVEHVD